MRILSLFLLLALFPSWNLYASEDPQTDSLITVLSKQPQDTMRVNTLLALSKKYFNSSPLQSLHYSRNALELSDKLNFKRGRAFSFKNIGIAYFYQGNYVDALQNYQSSMQVFKEIGDSTGVANIQSNIGNIYYNQGDDPNALDWYIKSLRISEELKDTLRISTALINIGAVYTNKKANYDLAIKHLLRALPLSEAIGNLDNTGTITVNLGEIYFDKGNDSLALAYFEKSLDATKGTDDAPYVMTDIGKLYTRRKEFDTAIKYLKDAYQLASELEAEYEMGIARLGLAHAYQEKGETQLALQAYKEAEVLCKATGANYALKEVYEGLSVVYAKLKDFRNAYSYQAQLVAIKDTIYNIDSDKKLQGLQFNYEIDKKQSEINLLTKDQELKQQEISRQKLMKNSFIGGFAIMLLFAGVFFTQRNRISKEKKRSDELLLNILPEETAEELKATGTARAKSFDMVTVMFTDFKNFTQASERLSAEDLVAEINYCYSEFDRIIMRYGIEKIKTIGDAYMCAGGLPVTNSTHPVDVVKAGLEMQEFIQRHKEERLAKDEPFFELRLGIHTGPVVAGIVGIKKFAYDIWGDTVNTASRMESSGQIGKVNISGTTYELIKDHFNCNYRGKVPAKNKGDIDMYFVESVRS